MASKTKMTSIRWREWNEAAFRTAQEEGKPVLLALTATWCHWCHVMDQTSYAHPEVIGLVNSRFIPVRVDVDQRPDISRRYNQGGFPSLAILDARAEIIAGRVYAPPEELVPLLRQVGDRYDPLAPGAGLSDGQRETGSPAAPQRDGQASTPGRVLRRLNELYDLDFGGFGQEPKQPPWEALGLLLARYSRTGDKGLLGMVTTTLDSIYAGLYDRMDQGFFRYSVSRDWRVPHYEKMLSSNASLAVAYLEAHQLTGNRLYRRVAAGILDYLLRTLYEPKRGLFHASQDAGEEYYRLPWKDRAQTAKPAIDRTFYTCWNALAAASLIKAFGALGGGQYLRTARGVLDLVWTEGWNQDQGISHVFGAEDHQPRYLADQVQAALAFLELHQATSDPEPLHRAIQVVDCARRLFGVPEGGFRDVSEGTTESGGLLRPERPVLENALMAEVLVRLSCHTGVDEYQEAARNTLEVFQGVTPGSSYLGPAGSRRMEEDEERLFLPAGSAWGRAWDLVEHGPVHMVLVGDPAGHATRRLLGSCLRTYAPHRVVQLLDPIRDRERIATLGIPASNQPALYVCMGGMCLAPITGPREVRGLAKSRPWAILERHVEPQS